ncbi:MAG: NUDIX hydrolase [Patescibacteria group bacterium]
MTPEIPHRQIIEVGKAAIINEAGQVLLVQRAADDSWSPSHWEIPGGKAEPGENLETALIRETQEETGLLIETLSELHLEEMVITEGHRKGNLYKVHSWVCKVTGGNIVLSSEHQTHKWLTLEEALSLNLTNPTRNALQRFVASQGNFGVK